MLCLCKNRMLRGCARRCSQPFATCSLVALRQGLRGARQQPMHGSLPRPRSLLGSRVCLARAQQQDESADQRQIAPETVDEQLAGADQPLVAQLSVQSHDPAEVLQLFLCWMEAGQLDLLLQVMPDTLIDQVAAWRKLTGRSNGGFADILEVNAGLAPEHQLFDSCALRNLCFGGPQHVRLLSAIRLSRDRYLQRCAIVAASGEECVLTFTMVRQETLEPSYGGIPRLTKRWMLACVAGECNSELPAHPSPSFPPEAVVEAQLQALRDRKLGAIFAHTSPESKAATGSLESYAAMLASSRYAPLSGFVAAESVRRLQPSKTTYMEVVKVTPAGGLQPQHYMFILSRQAETASWRDCWMVDAVKLLGPMVPAQVLQ